MAIDFTNNYFELFGLPIDYNIDKQQLSGQYQQLQKVIHPDKFSTSGAQERRLALQYAAHINQAYQTLKRPILRARYLAQLKLNDFSENKTMHDPEFLEQQLALREDLEIVKKDSNLTAAIEKLNHKLDEISKEINDEINRLFLAGDDNALRQILQWVDRWQFCDKLREEIELIEEQGFC